MNAEIQRRIDGAHAICKRDIIPTTMNNMGWLIRHLEKLHDEFEGVYDASVGVEPIIALNAENNREMVLEMVDDLRGILGRLERMSIPTMASDIKKPSQ